VHQDKISSKEEQNGSMTHITEHHTEEEWESDDGEHSWVSLLVSGNTIGIYNQLEHLSHIIQFNVSWSSNVVVFKKIHFHCRKLLDPSHDIVLFLGWSPEISNERLVLPFHHIECLIQSLFSCNKHFVNINSRNIAVTLLVGIKLVEDNKLISE